MATSNERRAWPSASTTFLNRKQLELQRLRDDYERLRTCLAICQHDLLELRTDRDTWALEGWVSRRARRRRERAQQLRERQRNDDEQRDHTRELIEIMGFPPPPSPTQSEVEEEERRKSEALDGRIASYRNRIKRTSVQLLVAAAAGYQYRETNLATRDGRLIGGIDPGIPRKYRAFEVRRTSSLSSTEAAARAIKTWLNDERRRRMRRGGPSSDAVGSSSEDDGRASLELSSTNDDGGGGGNNARMAVATATRNDMAPGTSDAFTVKNMGEFGGPSSRRPNQPVAPSAKLYNPRRWRLPMDTYDKELWLKTGFAARKDLNPVGWLTWKEQELSFPTLDSVLALRKWDGYGVWEPDDMYQHEQRTRKRKPLEADFTTKVSLERRKGLERREMNAFYQHYSQVPAALPKKLSDQEMRAGPLPPPPKLPLLGPSGEELIRPKSPSPIPFDKNQERYGRQFEPERQGPIPLTQHLYHTDSPAPSTFKFSDGSGVPDISKSNPLDEPDQVRGSQAIIEDGKKISKSEASLKAPYTFPGMPIELSLTGGQPTQGPTSDPLQTAPDTSRDTFWHYDGVNDNYSFLHSHGHKKRKTSDDEEDGKDKPTNTKTVRFDLPDDMEKDDDKDEEK
ncbi:hypothetical protein GGR54DRAFT_503767 [Hypoxylon sp. NC1633]|nr:hypothetical protein GGR54DRAFT_503767 [Hypoxylon sp. NC1633]